MQRLFHSVRDAVTAAWDRGRQVRYHAWVEHLRKLILEDAVPLFCQLKDDELDPDSMNMLCKMLEELEPTLDPAYTDGIGEKDEETLIAKQALLELWYHLLDSIERFSTKHKLNPVVFSVILGVIKRPEFDLTRLKVDAQGAFTCAEHELLLAQRYRHLLCQTTRFIAQSLAETVPSLPNEKAFQEMRRAALARSDAATTSGPLAALEAVASQVSKEQGTTEDKPAEPATDLTMFNGFGLAKCQLQQPTLAFATKFLAIAFWRLGSLRDDIISAVRADSPNLGPISELNKGIGVEDCEPELFPLLLSWVDFNSRVKAALHEPDNASRMYPSKDWLQHFNVYGEFFISFFFEWLQNVRSVLGAQHFAWSRLPGYRELAGRFLQLRGAMPPRALTSRQTFQAELNLLTTDNPMIVNRLIFNRFKATPASNLSAILETISALDVWFAELMKNHFFLGDPFDVEYFCRGVEMILQFDHHVALAKLIQMLYSYSDLFVGRNRLYIFGNLLLDKHFFDLFLHWDDNVRMMFIQLLVFKMLKTKRKVLREEASSSKEEDDPNNKYSPRAVDLLLLSKIDVYINIATISLEELKVHNPASLIGARAATRSSANAGGVTSYGIRRGFDPAIAIPVSVMDDLQTEKKPSKKRYVTEDGTPLDDSASSTEPKGDTATKEEKPEEEKETKEATTTDETDSDKTVITSTTSTTTTTTTTATEEKKAEMKADEVDLASCVIPEDKIIYLERSLALYKRHMSRYQEWQIRINAPVPPLVSLT